MAMAKIIDTFKAYEKSSNVKLLGMMKAALDQMGASPEIQKKILPDGPPSANGNIIELFFQLDIGAFGWMELATKPQKDLDPLFSAFRRMQWETDPYSDISLEKHLEYAAVEKCMSVLINNQETLLNYLAQVGTLFGKGNLVTDQLLIYRNRIKNKNESFFSKKDDKRKRIEETSQNCLKICKEINALKTKLETIAKSSAKPSFKEILLIERELLENKKLLIDNERLLSVLDNLPPKQDLKRGANNKWQEFPFIETIQAKQREIELSKSSFNVDALVTQCAAIRQNAFVDLNQIARDMATFQGVVNNQIRLNKPTSDEFKKATGELNETVNTIDIAIQQRTELVTDLQIKNQQLQTEIRQLDEKIMTQPHCLQERITDCITGAGYAKDTRETNQHAAELKALANNPNKNLFEEKASLFEAELKTLVTKSIGKLQSDLATNATEIAQLTAQRNALLNKRKELDPVSYFFKHTFTEAFGEADQVKELAQKILAKETHRDFLKANIERLTELGKELDTTIVARAGKKNEQAKNNDKIAAANKEITSFKEMKPKVTTFLKEIPSRISGVQAQTKAQPKAKSDAVITTISRTGDKDKLIKQNQAIQLVNEYIKNRCEKIDGKENPLLAKFLAENPKALDITDAVKGDNISKALKFIAENYKLESFLLQKITNIARAANLAEANSANDPNFQVIIAGHKETYVNAMKALYRMGATEQCNTLIGNPNLQATVDEKEEIALGIKRDYSIEGSFDTFRRSLNNAPARELPAAEMNAPSRSV